MNELDELYPDEIANGTAISLGTTIVEDKKAKLERLRKSLIRQIRELEGALSDIDELLKEL